MDIFETRNERYAKRVIEQLRRRHYEAYHCPSAADVLSKVKELIPEGSTVTWGGSMTIRDIGLTRMLKEGNYKVFDRDEAQSRDEADAIYRKAFECDFYLSSANAMSEDGQIVNIDGTGNRIAALSWGPKRVIYVISLHKVCHDLDAAVKRARYTAAPVNTTRFPSDTPCHLDGACHDCKSPDSSCVYFYIQRLSKPANRHIVILTDGQWGY